VAEATVRCLRRTVPAAVPGIAFLSGGQTDELATAHLDAINRTPGPHPWQLSFSYARALQSPALAAWKGDPARVAEGQRRFYHRARCNSAARGGTYTTDMERMVA
jgi:fructose-bisphosphate aldolase class I